MVSKKSVKKIVRKAKIRAAQTGHKVGNIIRAKVSGTAQVSNAKKSLRNSGKQVPPGANIPGSSRVAHGGPLTQKTPHPKKKSTMTAAQKATQRMKSNTTNRKK